MSELVATVSCVQAGSRRLVPVWSDEKARYVWQLEKFSGVCWWNEGVTGNFQWAEAIGYHYGITVPLAPNV